MKRREFITGLSGAAVLSPLAARAQQLAMPVIGFLNSGSRDGFVPQLDAFRAGIAEAGFIEGHNVSIEYRWADGHYERLPAFAADLVARPVAVIAALGGHAPAQAAKAATATIPIVFVSGGDPVSAGLVASFNRPGGNVTGVSWLATAIIPKQLDLLRRLPRKSAVIGALVNPNYPEHDLQLREFNEAGAAIGQEIRVARAASAEAIAPALASLVGQGAGALILANDPFFLAVRNDIVTLAARHALPAIYFLREFAAAGGLLSYGANLSEVVRQGALYVGRVLKGAKPAELPVLQPTRFEFVINAGAAKALGIEIPDSLLALADEVIE